MYAKSYDIGRKAKNPRYCVFKKNNKLYFVNIDAKKKNIKEKDDSPKATQRKLTIALHRLTKNEIAALIQNSIHSGSIHQGNLIKVRFFFIFNA